MKRLFALMLLAVGFASSAHADLIPATWTDSTNFNGGHYVAPGAEHSYTHDITDNGFRPGLDVLNSFRLFINLADDDNNFWRDGIELASVNLPGWDGDAWVGNFGLSGAEYGGWSIRGLAQLRRDGTLSVTISSLLGDFILVDSTLIANGLSETSTHVPEPGALGLLGVGLLGMAVSMRRRKQASR